jgi:hypothetical protein
MQPVSNLNSVVKDSVLLPHVGKGIGFEYRKVFLFCMVLFRLGNRNLGHPKIGHDPFSVITVYITLEVTCL